jgi:CubicO group peptidase (beta-lactamase class C family)
MFTAATIWRLAQQGRIDPGAPVSRYLPNLKNGGDVTIRQLLSHTGGISDRRTDSQRGIWRPQIDTATQVAEIGERPVSFAPGSDQRYSNSGFILLGAVIEKVTGKRWYDVVDREFLAPLGLTRTRYGASDIVIPKFVSGYSTEASDHQLRPAGYIDSSIPAAAGGLVSTADDLFHWIRALATGRAIGTAGFDTMTTPVVNTGRVARDPYGLGTYIWSVRGEKVVGHTGQIDGFASALMYDPAKQLTVVVLANDDNFDAKTLGLRLMATALGKPYVTGKPVVLSPEILAELAGTYRIDDAATETLVVRGGRLFGQRTGHNMIPLAMFGNELHFQPDELSYFLPVRGGGGRIVALDYFRGGEGPAVRYPRIPT